MYKVIRLLKGERASESSEQAVVLTVIVIGSLSALGLLGAKIAGSLNNVAGGI
jgi:hypothetical protein